MFEFIGKNISGKNRDDSKSDDEGSATPNPQFTFGGDDALPYQYPNLYEEADEMLHVSMLIYSFTDLRSLAKDPKRRSKLRSPEKILDLPLSLGSCLQFLDDNYDVMKECWGEADHINTINSLDLIHARFQRHHESTSLSSCGTNRLLNFIPITSIVHSSSQNIEVEQITSMLTHFGDENSEHDMVYAVGIDQLRKRVTVAFRGSVTTTDFQNDAMISMNRQPNPVYAIDSNQQKEIGVHHGFYNYLLRARANGRNKYQEIIEHVESLFNEYERHKDYKLYVTGHSLGGALATLFSLHASSSAGSNDGIIPTPVSCISVASPRVGDRAFQSSFCRLEELGYLRHLRIANDRDPVTMMPAATGKKLFARLSPISYLAFILMDNKFEENENFCHTGIKLRLAKNKWELSFLGIPMVNSELNEEVEVDKDSASCGSSESRPSIRNTMPRSRSIESKTKRQDSFYKTQMPDVTFHLGDAYTENLCSVRNDLFGLSLNDIYREKAVSIFLGKVSNT